ncbi:hypothetical protein OKW37_003793 [Paraburkholderia sp. MM5482-R2]
MIVDDLDIQRVLADEGKTDAPLRIDADAPLPAALALSANVVIIESYNVPR